MMQGIWLLFVLLICLRNFEAWKEWSGSLEDEKFADGIVEKFSYWQRFPLTIWCKQNKIQEKTLFSIAFSKLVKSLL